MQIVPIALWEDKQNISEVVSCYLSPNITSTQLFFKKVRSSLYKAQSDSLLKVLASAQVNVDHQIVQNTPISDIDHVPLQQKLSSLKCVLHSRLPPWGELSSWETQRATKMHCDWWRDESALNSLPLHLHLTEELRNQTIDDAVSTN